MADQECIVVNTPDAGPVSGETDEEVEFLKAMDAYKRRSKFPTWREVLAVLRSLGYRKVAPAGPLPVPVGPAGGSRSGPGSKEAWDRKERDPAGYFRGGRKTEGEAPR
jgi:hypothetical protein